MQIEDARSTLALRNEIKIARKFIALNRRLFRPIFFVILSRIEGPYEKKRTGTDDYKREIYGVEGLWHSSAICRVFSGRICGAFTSLRASPSGTKPMEIEIRASVDDIWNGTQKSPPKEHGKRYLIASVTESPSDEKLSSPVDKNAFAQQLRLALQTRGYTEIQPGQYPDVVLTILYGRGFLTSPYATVAAAGVALQSGSVVVLKSGRNSNSPRFEEKLQSAQNEKLFITVRAWKYPDQKAEKPKLLWHTTMIVGDPKEDLNRTSKAMLTAGAGFFDRMPKNEAVVVSDQDTHIVLKPLQILETDVAGSTPTEKPDKK